LASITLSRIGKAFGATQVLRDVDVKIDDGRFAVLVGPSGCGKSTLLRMIAGLDAPTTGQILIGDRAVNDIAAADRDIAMVFQNYALYPHLTVRKNLAFSLKMRKFPPAEIAARVSEAAQKLELEPLLDRLPRQLSGGQRQRVAMGRAIVRHPQAFLFDEPLSNLDAKLRMQMRIEIKSLHQQLGVTSVYVTHDQIEAMTMGDVIIVMNKGEVAQIGSPADVYDQPANLFVAQFIGSPAMNLFAGAIDGGKFVGEDGLRLPCAASTSDSVTCGIRPEALHLVAGASGSQPNNGFLVRLIERTGPEYHVYGTLGGRDAVAATKNVAALRVGAWAEASVMPQDIHLFDSKSGRRLPNVAQHRGASA
jgi:ABC-type sugar transport system ATPase subunit